MPHYKRGAGSPPACGSSGPICVIVPESFEPKNYLPERLHRHADSLRFMIHKIICGKAFSRDERRGFTNIHADSMRRFFANTSAYTQSKDCLLNGGAIICDNTYIVGEKSRGYVLSPELSAMRHQKVIVTDHFLARKINRSHYERSRSLNGVHQHLFKNLQSIDIDHDAALAWLHEKRDYEPWNHTAIRFIRDREFYFQVCAYGRVHTNVTNLMSGLRQFLSVGGESLVNLDVRNSQPLIFAALLVGTLKAGRGEDVPLPPDAAKYVELVQAGQFYDYLMEESGIRPHERSAFKEKFFGSTFFCKNDPVKEEAEKFAGLFPSVYALIGERKKDDYTALATDMQRTESAVIIDGVANRCAIELPHAFVSTIHDSILTTARHAEIIQGFMTDEFAGAGLKPTIRREIA